MDTGLYTATSENKLGILITPGRYRRRKGNKRFWHTMTLDNQTLLEVGKTYCVLFTMKKGGLLHSVTVTPKKSELVSSLQFRQQK